MDAGAHGFDRASCDPLERKKALAHDVVQQLHGEAAADRAQRHFERTIQQGQAPDSLQTIAATDLLALIAAARGESRSRARQLVEGGAVRIGEQRITDPKHPITAGDIVCIGRAAVRVG